MLLNSYKEKLDIQAHPPLFHEQARYLAHFTSGLYMHHRWVVRPLGPVMGRVAGFVGSFEDGILPLYLL